MSDDQKFQHLKKEMLDENNQKYGDEVKQRWGEKAWKESNHKFEQMTQAQLEAANRVNADFQAVLHEAFGIGDPAGDFAKKAVDLHRQWLQNFWPEYSVEAHVGLAEMYVADERFHHNFDNNKKLAEFFRDAVKAATGV